MCIWLFERNCRKEYVTRLRGSLCDCLMRKSRVTRLPGSLCDRLMRKSRAKKPRGCPGDGLTRKIRTTAQGAAVGADEGNVSLA